jgi:hypothetical protein
MTCKDCGYEIYPGDDKDGLCPDCSDKKDCNDDWFR